LHTMEMALVITLAAAVTAGIVLTRLGKRLIFHL